MNNTLQEHFKALIGLTISQAEGFLGALYSADEPLMWDGLAIFLVRATSQNGEHFPVTCDFNTGRINVDVDDEDKIQEIYSVG